MSLEHSEIDLDLGAWSADWQSAGPEPEASFDTIRRGFRRYTWSAAGGWLVGALMVAVTSAMAWLDRQPALIAAAVAVWIFAAAAVGFDLRYRRGTWRLAGESTRDFLELARRRLVARLRGIRFGWFLLAAETVFFVFWIPWVAGLTPSARGEVQLWGFGYLAAFVTVFAIGLVILRRRAERELAGLERVREALVDRDLAA